MRCLLVFSLLLVAAERTRAASDVDYELDIKPIFAEKCASCHGALKQESGLRLDNGGLIRQGSENGAVIAIGNAADSALIERVSSADVDVRMPPEGVGEPLNAKQIALLRAWINQGAASPIDEPVPEDPTKHWSYQIPQRSPLPEIADENWSHPIDRFIAAKHRQQGITAVEKADRYTLLRRIYLDLIGLPPTREQIHEFFRDDSEKAWLKVVDSLLESPHYGERWGRHWMDVWRYSDWDGYKQQVRGSQRHIWHWRDWIVQSLNADKGYDQMIVEMLAADEIAPEDPDLLAATGFLARNFHNSNRNIWLDNTVEHTSKAFLGLTLNCARCHDHKYDPIPQLAYYQFRAIFEPHNVRTDRFPGKRDVMKDGLPRAFDAELTAKTFLYLGGNDKHPDKDNPLAPAVPEVLGGELKIQPVELPISAYFPALKSFINEEDLEQARRQLAAAKKKHLAATQPAGDGAEATDASEIQLLKLTRDVADLRLRSLEARYAADRAKYATPQKKSQFEKLSTAAAETERLFNVRQAELTVMQKQAAFTSAKKSDEQDAAKKKTAIDAAKKALDDAEKALAKTKEKPEKKETKYTSVGTEYPRTSSGRRLALARWIASAENPLTARVAVNQIWLRHFGEPLVDNVFDFGLRSPKPRHAELLDWLAVELMENNWSMKHLHRVIVTSRTWQLASSAGQVHDSHADQIDPDNHLLWRANARRLDAEIVRDNVLAVSGQLDPMFGGADVDFADGEKSRRRSIYIRHAYEKQMTMLVLFDAASPTECYRRSESIIPQQALALSNSSLALGKSRMLARQLSNEVGGPELGSQTEFVRQTFLQILSRPPADDEYAVCLQFLSDQAQLLSDTSALNTFTGGTKPVVDPAADPQQRARENLVHVLMNHNDFVTMR